MSAIEKTRACYQHSCLKYMSNERMTNTSLRERFGIEDRNYSTASRIINETIKAELVKCFDISTSKKMMSYVPFWA